MTISLNKSVSILGSGNTRLAGADGWNHFRVLEVWQASHLALADLTILNGSDAVAGGLHVAWDSSADVERVSFWANERALMNEGTVELRDCEFGNNYANYGSAIYNTGWLRIIDSRIVGSTTNGGSGTVFSEGATAHLMLIRTEIADNRAWLSGGALYTTAGTTTTIEASSFHGNSARLKGGAIYHEGAPLEIKDSTIGENSVEGIVGEGFGGGIWTSGDVELRRSTLAFNYAATSGGGIYATIPAVVITGSILANNQSALGANCGGEKPTSWGFNLEDRNECGLLPGFDLAETDPWLIPELHPYGGTTPLFALSRGSWAIDFGGGCTVDDQRGVIRPLDGNGDGTALCDIGAFEYNGQPLTDTLLVETSADLQDLNPGDRICETESHRCSLRAAIQEGNGAGKPVSIELPVFPSGPYSLALAGIGEDLGATGDLDISGTISIRADSPADWVQIDATGVDRVFDVLSGTLTLERTVVSNGVAVGDGGGLRNTGALVLINVRIEGNVAGNGGGVYNSGSVQGTNVTVRNNSTNSLNGGGIYNSGEVSLVESDISYNDALVSGDGILNYFGTIELSNTIVGGNGGTGIHNYLGTVTLANGTYLLNSVVGLYQAGNEVFGAVYADETSIVQNQQGMVIDGGVLSLTRCLVAMNGPLGGLEIWPHEGTITNTTIVNNGGPFGALYLRGGSLSVNNATISWNSSGGSGAVRSEPGSTLEIGNSIVSGCSLAGTTLSLGHNLDSGDSCMFDGTGDLIFADPLLGTLGNHSGRTSTVPLLDGSPAIDAGSPLVPRSATGACEWGDQRGVPRPQGERCDIGAFEVVEIRIFLPVVAR